MDLIKELGLEKCKAIVDGAPRGAEKYHPENKYYVKDIDPDHLARAEEYRHETWLIGHMSSCTHKHECDCDCVDGWEENSAWVEYMDVLIDLSDLRTAIASHECDHDWEDISCNGDLERQLICTYCSMKKSEPFALNEKRWSQEDEDSCVDIKNHISPNTKVIEK